MRELVLFSHGTTTLLLSLSAHMQKVSGVSVQFLFCGSQENLLDQETYSDIQCEWLVVVERELTNLMTCCLKILPAGQIWLMDVYSVYRKIFTLPKIDQGLLNKLTLYLLIKFTNLLRIAPEAYLPLPL